MIRVEGCVLTGQFLSLSIRSVALNGSKVEIAFRARKELAVYKRVQLCPNVLMNTLSLCC